MKPNRKTRIIFSGLILLMALSVSLNAILYERLRHFYIEMYAVRLDPLGLSSFQAAVDHDARPIIVLFGDSRAAQWPAPQINGYQVVNRGIGNQTSAQVVSRFDAHVKPLHPDIVILQVGINDLKIIPLFPKQEREIISNCKANILTMIQESLQMGAAVVVTTIFPTGQVPLIRRLVWSEQVDKAIREVNEFIRTLEQDRVLVFDTANLLLDTNDHMKQEYSFDTLHLNARGYDVLNQELIPILKSLEK